MIRLVNLKNYIPLHDDELCIRICRPSPLGNPFLLKDNNNKTERDIVCDQYEKYFNEQLINSKTKDTPFLRELRRIFKLSLTHDIALGCFCYPYKRCHGETILNFLNKMLETYNNNKKGSR